MKSNAGLVIFASLASAVIGSLVTMTVAAQPDPTVTPTASAVSKADVEKLLADRERKLRGELDEQIAKTVPTAPMVIERPATPAAGSTGEADAEELGELRKRIEDLDAHVLALEGRLQEFENAENRRMEQFARDQVDSGVRRLRDGATELLGRAPEMMERFSGGAVDRMRQQLDLDDTQAEQMRELMGNSMREGFEMMGKVRSGEMTQEQAREEMQRMQQRSEDEMQRILTPQQMERMRESGGMGIPGMPGMGGGRNRGGNNNNNGGGNNLPPRPDRNRERGF